MPSTKSGHLRGVAGGQHQRVGAALVDLVQLGVAQGQVERRRRPTSRRSSSVSVSRVVGTGPSRLSR